MEDNDTIVALATPHGIGAMAIIRMSGEKSFKIFEKIVEEKEKARITEKRYAQRYTIIDHKKKLDEVIAIKYKKPGTYTGEDIIEVISHGGEITPRKIIDVCIKKGARIAQRGEFTRRAFLNGKMDLIKAEAIKALIESKNEGDYSIAIKSYEGKEIKRIKDWEERIKKEISYIDAEIEFGEEEEIGSRDRKEIKKVLKEIMDEIKRAEKIEDVKGGYRIALAGPPNAGKSTLFNFLLGYERNIISNTPGTTRDAIYEKVVMEKKEINLIDTAGIRRTKNEIENAGINRTMKEINAAHVVIWISGIDEKITEEEIKWVRGLEEKNTIYLLNKIDKTANEKKREYYKKEGKNAVEVSLLKEKNIGKLVSEIEKKIKIVTKKYEMPHFIVTTRQKKITEEMSENLKRALNEWKRKEISSYYLKESIKNIEWIFGKSDRDEILDEIFDNFCIGK